MPGTVAERWSATEQANHLGLEARPRTSRELAQQLAVEPGVQSQTPGDGQDDLPMGDGKTDFFGNVHRGQQGPLLVAGWARTTLLAGEGDKHLVLAVGAANSGKAFLQIAAPEKGCHGLLDDGPPETVPGLKAFIVDLLKRVKVLVEQMPQIRRVWIAWTIEGRQFETRQSHEQHATSRLTVGNRKADSRSLAA